MNKSRLESFTDGVFAIAITILVLNIHLPDGANHANLGSSLASILPSIGTFVLSFLLIGLYWTYHHSTSQLFRKIDAQIVWLNLLNLLFVCFLPFTTSLFGKFTFDSWAAILYGGNLIAMNAVGSLAVLYLQQHPDLAEAQLDAARIRRSLHVSRKVSLIYAAAIVLAFFVPRISIYLYALVALYLILTAAFPKASQRI